MKLFILLILISFQVNAQVLDLGSLDHSGKVLDLRVVKSATPDQQLNSIDTFFNSQNEKFIGSVSADKTDLSLDRNKLDQEWDNLLKGAL